MRSLIDSMLVELSIIIETDKNKMSEWVVDQGLQKVTEDYLGSDEFREFTEASVEESDDYRERIMSGEDPEKVLQEMTDEAIENQTYWNDFLADGGYDVDAMEEIRGEIKYVTPGKDKKEYIEEVESTWNEVPGASIPTIDVQGSAHLSSYEGSFLPFRIREVEQDLPEIEDVHMEFQTYWAETKTGELSLYKTKIIALDKGPIDASLYASENSRLISLEGIRDYDDLEVEDDNGLPSQVLRKSINLVPGTNESIQYYMSLLEMPEFSGFDDEQVEFILGRIGDIQKLIDERPEKMAVLLKSIWKKLKSMDKYKDLEFPESISKEAGLISDLTDIGL
jgi:hypothetical protein